MDPDEDKERSERVIALVNEINRVLAGLPIPEAHTALTLAVVCGVVCTTESAQERASAAEHFTQQVRDYVQRDDIVEWLKACTSYGPFSGRSQ